jgi:hypothetical protein
MVHRKSNEYSPTVKFVVTLACDEATLPSCTRNDVASTCKGGNARQNLTKAGRAGMKNADLLLLGNAASSDERRLSMNLATPMALVSGYWRARYEASSIANSWKGNKIFASI